MLLQQEYNTLSSVSHTQPYSLTETDVQQGTVGEKNIYREVECVRRGERGATDGEMKVLIMAYGSDSVFVFSTRHSVFTQ